jgi:hypothetical protein
MLATIHSRTLSCHLLSKKNVKTGIYKTIILRAVFVRMSNLVSDIKGGTQTEGV